MYTLTFISNINNLINNNRRIPEFFGEKKVYMYNQDPQIPTPKELTFNTQKEALLYLLESTEDKSKFDVKITYKNPNV